jgi:hypothetical protein
VDLGVGHGRGWRIQSKIVQYLVCGSLWEDNGTYLRLNNYSERGSGRLDAYCRRSKWPC